MLDDGRLPLPSRTDESNNACVAASQSLIQKGQLALAAKEMQRLRRTVVNRGRSPHLLLAFHAALRFHRVARNVEQAASLLCLTTKWKFTQRYEIRISSALVEIFGDCDMLTFLMATLLFVGDPSSGPKVGEKLGGAKVKGIFEPIEGKEFNLLGRAKKEPTVIVFVQRKDQKDITRPTFRLLKDIDKAVGEEEKLNAIFVWVTDDVGKTEEFLNRAKGSLK